MKTELEINKKYGKWIILSFDGVDSRRRRRYICKCECGIEKSLAAAAVASGKTKSCSRCRAANLVGKTFGRWVVKELSKNISKNGHTSWLCECSCGKTSFVERCNLVNGKSRGCWECQRDVLLTEYFPRIWYRKQIEQAKMRGHTWNLAEKDLWDIWQAQKQKCPLTNLNLIICKESHNMTASIDRIDSSKGYEIENVWFVHKHVNLMKFKFDLDYFITMCKLVATTAGTGL